MARHYLNSLMKKEMIQTNKWDWKNSQEHWEKLSGVLQREGSPRARVMLIFKPRSGSSLSLIIMHMHFLLFLVDCMRPLQQSDVGELALPPRYGRHVVRSVSCSAHFCFSCADSPIVWLMINMNDNVNTTMYGGLPLKSIFSDWV